MIENKYLLNLENKCAGATWVRNDAALDKFRVGDLISEYQSNDLFADQKVFLIRHADIKGDRVFELCSTLVTNPIGDHTVVLIADGWNKTTKLGKLIKKHFVVKELNKPQIKPFDMLDFINERSTAKVLSQCNRLFDNDYNHLAIFSLLFGHFLLLRQVVARKGMGADVVAREIKQHPFRVKKAMVATRHWTLDEIDDALGELIRLDSFLRFSEYDRTMTIQKMLLSMALIKILI